MMTSSIELALESLTLQDAPSINATAKKFGVVESTLRRRWKGETVPRIEANSIHRQKLTNAQEASLIQTINRLTDRGIPPTGRIVRNLAEEVVGGSVEKNWTKRFVGRHKDELKSLYLKNIDSKRTKSEYISIYKQFYDLVNSIHQLESYAMQVLLNFIR